MRYEFGTEIAWTGNRGTGTSGPRDFSRAHTVSASGRPDILASADRAFHGDRDRWNPELLLLAALGECHMMSYFFAAAQAGIVVTGYTDTPTGTLEVVADGSGQFVRATLSPTVVIAHEGDRQAALDLHERAAQLCFIARSINFPVDHKPEIVVELGD